MSEGTHSVPVLLFDIGVSRLTMCPNRFRGIARENFARFRPEESINDEAWTAFSQVIRYVGLVEDDKPLPPTRMVIRLQPNEDVKTLLVTMAVVRGNLALCMRRDEVETAWKGLNGIFNAWDRDETPVHKYPADTDGPVQSATLLDGDQRKWWSQP